MSISSLVVVLSALLCPGGRVATGSPPLPSRPSWLVWSSPWPPSGSVLVVAGAILGWHGQESWAKFFRSLHTSFFILSTNHLAAIMVPNFLQPPQITFTFSTNHLAANIIQHRPTTVCHPGISSPPRPALYGEATSCECFPPNPSPLLFTSLENWWPPLWLGGGFARRHLAW